MTHISHGALEASSTLPQEFCVQPARRADGYLASMSDAEVAEHKRSREDALEEVRYRVAMRTPVAPSNVIDFPAPKKEPVAKRRFLPASEADMDLAPSTRWLIPKLIPEAATALLVGETGTFKSFLAQMIALHVSAGLEVFGATPEPGTVFYGALEGLSGIKGDRRKAWKQAHGVAAVPNFFALAAPLAANEADCREFMDEIAAINEKPRLIVLETVSKILAGLNENSAQDIGRLTHFCDELVRRFECAVLVIHHKSDKPGAADIRGSSALKAGFDTVLEVSADRQRKIATVRCTKQKDDGEAGPWSFQGKVVGPSLTFSPCSTPRKPVDEAEAADRGFVSVINGALHEMAAMGLDNGVTTSALAQHLAGPPQDDEGENDQLARVHAWAKRLDYGSRDRKDRGVTYPARFGALCGKDFRAGLGDPDKGALKWFIRPAPNF